LRTDEDQFDIAIRADAGQDLLGLKFGLPFKDQGKQKPLIID
jgi:hypothetical protein